MESGRGPLRTAPPFARFRCLVCQLFVVGTEAGHCPRCGYVPPSAPAAPAPRAPWPLAAIVLAAAIAIAVIVLLGR